MIWKRSRSSSSVLVEWKSGKIVFERGQNSAKGFILSFVIFKEATLKWFGLWDSFVEASSSSEDTDWISSSSTIACLVKSDFVLFEKAEATTSLIESRFRFNGPISFFDLYIVADFDFSSGGVGSSNTYEFHCPFYWYFILRYLLDFFLQKESRQIYWSYLLSII